MNKFMSDFLNETKTNSVEVVDVSRYKFKWHEVSYTEPNMSENDYQALKANILAVGQNIPIIIFKEKVIDGRHRQKACIELNMSAKIIRLKKNYTTPQLREIVRSIHMGRNKTPIQLQIQAYKYKRTVANVTWEKASEKYGVKTVTIKKINSLFNLLNINGHDVDFERVIETLFMGLNLLPSNFAWINTPTSSIASSIKQFKDYVAIQEMKAKEIKEVDSTEKQVIIDNETGEVLTQDIIKEENPLIEIVARKDSEIEKLKSENEALKEKLKKYESVTNEQ